MALALYSPAILYGDIVDLKSSFLPKLSFLLQYMQTGLHRHVINIDIEVYIRLTL